MVVTVVFFTDVHKFNPGLTRHSLACCVIVSVSLVQTLTHKAATILQVFRYLMAPDEMKW